jgi:hypothetical protein
MQSAAGNNAAAAAFAFSNTTIAANKPVDSISINFTSTAINYPVNAGMAQVTSGGILGRATSSARDLWLAGFVREADSDSCADASKRVYEGTIQEAGCTALRAKGSKCVPAVFFSI